MPSSGKDAEIGLCGRCLHARVHQNPRGSAFYMCTLFFTDKRFPKYPSLPVINCDGYDPKEEQDDRHREMRS